MGFIICIFFYVAKALNQPIGDGDMFNVIISHQQNWHNVYECQCLKSSSESASVVFGILYLVYSTLGINKRCILGTTHP